MTDARNTPDRLGLSPTPLGQERTGPVEFGRFRYDRSRILLTRDEQEIPLPPRVLALLEYLLDRPGEAVTKDELLEAVWEGRLVGEESLTQAISVLRQALGDDPQHPEYIRTIPRHGYLWLAPLTCGEGTSARRVRRRRRRLVSLGFRILVLLVAVISAIPAVRWLRPGSDDALYSLPPDRSGPPAESTLPTPRSTIAVLGFENLGPAEDDYFAAGMAEEILGRLGSSSELLVISARRLEGELDLGEHVQYLLEGGVRMARDSSGRSRVRITPRLMRRADRALLWAAVYDRDLADVFAVQAEIATKVLAEIGVHLGCGERSALDSPPTAHVEAYEAYLRARESHDRLGDYGLAARLYERAVRLDPRFADAYASLSVVKGDRYRRGVERTPETLVEIRRAIESALALGPERPLVRLAEGRYAMNVEEDWGRALDIFSSLSEDYPSFSSAHGSAGFVSLMLGREEDAVLDYERARALEPQSAGYARASAELYRGLRRFEAAEELWDRAILLDPSQSLPHARRAETRLARGEDLAEVRRLLSTAPDGYEVDTLLIDLDLTTGHYDRALSRGLRLLEDPSSLEGPWQEVAVRIQVALGLRLSGDEEAARRALGALDDDLSELLARQPDSVVYLRQATEVAALQGREDDALDLARSAIDRVSEQRWYRPSHEETLALALAWTGHPHEALDLLARLLENRYWRSLTPALLATDARWTPLRDEPRFRELIGSGAS